MKIAIEISATATGCLVDKPTQYGGRLHSYCEWIRMHDYGHTCDLFNKKLLLGIDKVPNRCEACLHAEIKEEA